MPFTHEFVIDKKKFDKRILSELQHKIRVPLKCYTISEFTLNIDNTFSFKKKIQKLIGGNRMTIADPAVHHGSYIKEDFNVDTYRVIITFYD